MLQNKDYYLVSWSPVGGSTVDLGPKPLNIDLHESICKWKNFLLYAIRFVTTISKLELTKFKVAKGGQLGPKDPVNAPMQTD